jgi:hypothetical protein
MELFSWLRDIEDELSGGESIDESNADINRDFVRTEMAGLRISLA